MSRTNNTKAIAEIIHQNVGGTLVALELEKPYPENYQAIVQQVVNENETGFLPPLKTRIDSIAKYDVIFLGFPTQQANSSISSELSSKKQPHMWDHISIGIVLNGRH